MRSKSNMPLEYYDWLCDMVDIQSHKNYSMLLSYLFDKEFFWTVKNDVNRAEDGKNLRHIFISETEFDDDLWVDEPCSVLEMLIALARRTSIDIMPDLEMDISYWFWQFLDNINALKMSNFSFEVSKICEICDNLMQKSGKNELFCVKKITQREKKVTEFWYLLQFWLDENYDF